MNTNSVISKKFVDSNAYNLTGIRNAIEELDSLGVDTSNLNEDYYKVPLEGMDLSKYEKEHPKKGKVVSKHTIIIDSRQRDYSLYPTPSYYQVELMEPHRNVERIELIAAMMPKTCYNINSENNLILLTINGLQQALYLTPGQYLIGSNIQGNVNYQANGTGVFTGLMSELENTLNTHTNSGNNFNVFLATAPSSSGGTGVNAAILNRIIITNSSVSFSIDFTNTGYISGSPFRVLGFYKQIYTSNTSNVIYGSDDLGTCTQSNLNNGTTHTISIASLVGIFDYDLKDDPQYLIMQLDFGNRSAERVESIDVATNQKFAMVIYDANEPDNIQNYNYTTTTNGNVQIGFSRPAGRLKALKGSDFDKKVLEFSPPITLENFTISFFKYDNTPYDFNNREHLLTFELDVADYDPTYRY
jgi:hypothetical protein